MLAYKPENSAYIPDKVVRQKTAPFPMTNRGTLMEENFNCNRQYVDENVF